MFIANFAQQQIKGKAKIFTAERLKWDPPFCEKCKIPMMLIQEDGSGVRLR